MRDELRADGSSSNTPRPFNRRHFLKVAGGTVGALALVAAGCSDDVDNDNGPRDTGRDAGQDSGRDTGNGSDAGEDARDAIDGTDGTDGADDAGDTDSEVVLDFGSDIGVLNFA